MLTPEANKGYLKYLTNDEAVRMRANRFSVDDVVQMLDIPWGQRAEAKNIAAHLNIASAVGVLLDVVERQGSELKALKTTRAAAELSEAARHPTGATSGNHRDEPDGFTKDIVPCRPA